MQATLTDFIAILRRHQVPISTAEALDAVAVTSVLGYADRKRLRDGLAVTLAKTAADEAVVHQCFERYFGRQLQAGAPPVDSDAGAASAAEAASGDTVHQLLQADAAREPALQRALDSPVLQQVLANDQTGLAITLGRAAGAVGLGDMRLFTQRGQYTRRMLDALGEEVLRDAIRALERADSPLLELLRNYRDRLRSQVRDYVDREYLLRAEGDNRRQMEEILRRTRLNNIERRYLHEVQTLVRKLARKLAARHARRPRVENRGRLDMARTLRRGIPHDGILFQPQWRRQRRDKASLLAICDVSGSVAAHARFLLLFLYSLQDVLPRVRSFAFSSHLGEVSELFLDYPVERAIEEVNRRYGGATDYGRSLLDFARLALDDVDSRTTVVILGDARTNGGNPELEVLQSIYQRSRRVIWLNPESRRAWGTGDSEMLRYQRACHFTAECNTLKQLERIVDQLLRLTG
jgi:uncharacterized protein with von Willebrand factor type A (vWA) domain